LRLSEKSKIVLPILLIAVFVFATFGLIYRFQNHEMARIVEAERLLDQISEGMFEINRTIQSGILTLDEKYAVQSAQRSLRIFDKLSALENLHSAEAAAIRRMYLAYYVKLVSINSIFLEKRLDEGRTRLADLDMSFSRISAEMKRMIDLRTVQYGKAVSSINVFMAVTSVIFTAMITLIAGLFMRSSRKRKEAERSLIASEKMAALGALSAGVAHEIKNPLTIILHGIERLEASPSDGFGRQDIMNGIKQAVLRADGIIKGLLSFTQGPASGREKLEVLAVLEEALRILGQQRELRHIRIERGCLPEAPEARGDGAQIRQAFLNILVNAVEAMPGGGILRIFCEKMNANSFSITFADTGAGIPDADIGKVLDPFYSLKRKTGNTGLGLSIARGIIEGHGGMLKIESAPGEGTRVTVQLSISV